MGKAKDVKEEAVEEAVEQTEEAVEGTDVIDPEVETSDEVAGDPGLDLVDALIDAIAKMREVVVSGRRPTNISALDESIGNLLTIRERM